MQYSFITCTGRTLPLPLSYGFAREMLCISIFPKFLDEFAKLQRSTVSFVMSVNPFACSSAWKNLTPIGLILIIF